MGPARPRLGQDDRRELLEHAHPALLIERGWGNGAARERAYWPARGHPGDGY